MVAPPFPSIIIMETDKKEGVIIAEKVCHKGMLHGSAERKTIIPMKDSNFYLEFIPTGDKFTLVRIMACNPETTINYSYTPRIKKVMVKSKSLIPKIPNSQVTLKDTVEIEEII